VLYAAYARLRCNAATRMFVASRVCCAGVFGHANGCAGYNERCGRHARLPVGTAGAAEHGGIAVLHRDTHFDKLVEILTFENVELPGS
jgi:hypothetical protein